MFTRKVLYTISAILVFGVLATSSTGAVNNSQRTTYLTFSGPVRLPGVTLGAGTYTFELPLPESNLALVRVTSRDHRHVFYTGFTTLIQRPQGMSPDLKIVLGEAPANMAPPITAWFPQDENTGREFRY